MATGHMAEGARMDAATARLKVARLWVDRLTANKMWVSREECVCVFASTLCMQDHPTDLPRPVHPNPPCRSSDPHRLPGLSAAALRAGGPARSTRRAVAGRGGRGSAAGAQGLGGRGRRGRRAAGGVQGCSWGSLAPALVIAGAQGTTGGGGNEGEGRDKWEGGEGQGVGVSLQGEGIARQTMWVGGDTLVGATTRHVARNRQRRTTVGHGRDSGTIRPDGQPAGSMWA